jgi:uncharacterized protein YneF (UPF0154 family)
MRMTYAQSVIASEARQSQFHENPRINRSNLREEIVSR